MVEVVHWNPRRRKLHGMSFGSRVNNFGDMVGPFIVESLRQELELPRKTTSRKRLLAVGSVMHFARDGDTIWGAGVNGKIAREQHSFQRLDVRAVRGPRTRCWLEEHGVSAPEIYGDPALLLPRFVPELVNVKKVREYALIPNLNDASKYRNHPAYVNPRAHWMAVTTEICTSEFVVGSSLHALVIAEAFGVPVVLMKSAVEPEFKYLDYIEGTGRQAVDVATTIEEAISEGRRAAARGSQEALRDWALEDLIRAFPADLWRPRGAST